MPNDLRDFRAEMNSGPNGEEKRVRMRNFNELFNEMPRFDFDKYNVPFDPDEVEFVPQEVTEQQIIDGMVESSCPFSFLIDQINFFGQ